MKSKHPALEAVLVASALGAYVLYHVWFFFLKQRCGRVRRKHYYGITGKGKIARLMFTHMVSTDSKAAILGVQQSRRVPRSLACSMPSHRSMSKIRPCPSCGIP
jgi:hypothetical protein